MPFPIKKKQAILFDIRFELLAQINSNQFKFARETIIIPSFFFFVEAETSQSFTLSKKFPKLVPPSAIIDQSLSTQLVSPHVRVIKGLASNPWKFPFPSPSPPSPDRHHFASSPPRKSCYVPFSRRFPSLQSPLPLSRPRGPCFRAPTADSEIFRAAIRRTVAFPCIFMPESSLPRCIFIRRE